MIRKFIPSILKKTLVLFSASIVLILPVRADQINLIKNGDFSQIKKGQAESWYTGTERPDDFQDTFPSEAGHGNVAQMVTTSGVVSTYFTQKITVKPHTNYRFSALSRVDQGMALIWIYGGGSKDKLDNRTYVQLQKYFPLFPGFWNQAWLEGSSKSSQPQPVPLRVFTVLTQPGQWQPVSMNFNSGNLTSMTVSLGSYFAMGRYLFDDVSVTEITDAK
jgi:hypothetical protein